MSTDSSDTPHNVHGWERAASVAGGLYLLGHGLRRGGIVGLLQVAMGGLAAARGVTGRCAAKQAILDAREHLRDCAPQLDVTGSDLQDLRANAEAATGTATITGYGGPNT